MIRINLAPAEEIENKLWFLPDVAVAASLALIFAMASYLYLDYLDKEILQKNVETAEHRNNTKALEPAIKELKEHKERIAVVRDKIRSLENITVSKTEKYRSAILLEHLQNIKPEGVWFTSLVENSDNSSITISGGAFDNIIIAEFMSSLESTRLQESDPTDLRTQIYFDRVELGKIIIEGKQKIAESTNVSVNSSAPAQTSQGSGQGKVSPIDIYENYRNFPTFDLIIQYASREPQSLKTDSDEFKL